MNENSGKYASRLLNKLAMIWLLNAGTLLLVVIILYWFDRVAAYSALLGGLLFIIPNVYFTACAFRHNAKSVNSAVMVRGFYKGESGKFILSLTGFAVIFASALPIDALALFATYIVLTLTHWVLALWLEF